MRRVVQVLFAVAVLLGLLGAVGWLVYTSITEAPGVGAAVVAPLGALIGLFVQRYLERQREAEGQRRERMAPIYEQLVETFYRGAASGETDEAACKSSSHTSPSDF